MELLASIPSVHTTPFLNEPKKQCKKDAYYHLYVWQIHEKIVGLIGIEVHAYTFIVRHMVVHPSFRNEGIGHAMVAEVQRMQEPRAMTSSEETKQFLTKCWGNLFN